MSLKSFLKKRNKLHAVNQIKRLDTTKKNIDGLDIGTRKIINLLNYTKRSLSSYDGDAFDVGYHSFKINGKEFKGQRNPKKRFSNVAYDFIGKTVLDIGCNQGGMINEVHDAILYGVGIDFDSRMINIANRIRSYKNSNKMDFYVFDLDNENLDYIYDFLPENKVDICFLLSVCMWLKKWKKVVRFAHDISDSLLFETNGKAKQQEKQIALLNQLYPRVDLCSASSEDDPKQKKRKLFLCHK